MDRYIYPTSFEEELHGAVRGHTPFFSGFEVVIEGRRGPPKGGRRRWLDFGTPFWNTILEHVLEFWNLGAALGRTITVGSTFILVEKGLHAL